MLRLWLAVCVALGALVPACADAQLAASERKVCKVWQVQVGFNLRHRRTLVARATTAAS